MKTAAHIFPSCVNLVVSNHAFVIVNFLDWQNYNSFHFVLVLLFAFKSPIITNTSFDFT